MLLYLLFRPATLKPLPFESTCGDRRAKSPNVREIEGMLSMTAVLTFWAAPVRDWLITGLGAVTVTPTSILACSSLKVRLRFSPSLRVMSVSVWGAKPVSVAEIV